MAKFLSLLRPRGFKQAVILGLLTTILFFQLFTNLGASSSFDITTLNSVSIDRDLDAYPSIYQRILKKRLLNDLMIDKDMDHRCHHYFDDLYREDHGWQVNPNEKFDYDSFIFNKDGYMDRKKDQIRRARAERMGKSPQEVPIDDDITNEARLAYQDYLDQVTNVEHKLLDSVSHLRVFSSCYIMDRKEPASKLLDYYKKFQRTGSVKDKTTDHECSDIEARIFPWLSRASPVFKRWNGEMTIGNPRMSDYVTYEEFRDVYDFSDTMAVERQREEELKKQQELNKKAAAKAKKAKKPSTTLKEVKLVSTDPAKPNVYSWTAAEKLNKRSDQSSCFLKNLRNTLNGKGIVITVGDQFVEDTCRLITLLRGLNNKLPIEIIYKSGLSQESINRIIAASRDDLSKIPKTFLAVEHIVGVEFPPQEVWFVNCDLSIHESYRGKFDGFGNKFLASFFTSFEEFILLDTDTVIFKKPDYFFQLQKYKQTGTFYFRDRFFNQLRPQHDLDFYSKLMPSNLDGLMFNINSITNYTTDNAFFKNRLFHYMESGVVVIDKRRHFHSLLMSIQLWFWEPTRMRSHGDKELFWLGHILAGDEDYHFNRNWASAVGTLSLASERGEHLISREICTNRPAHISEQDDVTLLWMNSGFKFCKKEVNHDQDLRKHFSFLQTHEEFQRYYDSKVSIRHAIITPTDVEHLVIKSDDGEASTGWVSTEYCSGYTWCAYDRIGGAKDPHAVSGKFIEYDNVTTSLFDYYGDLWIGND